VNDNERGQQPTTDKRRDVLKTLRRHRWYRPALQALASEPARYVDLLRNVKDRKGIPPAESQLNLALKGLVDLHLAEKDDPADIRSLWRLTEQGDVALRDLSYFEQVQRASWPGPYTAQSGADVCRHQLA
jgi:hypothetical protein